MRQIVLLALLLVPTVAEAQDIAAIGIMPTPAVSDLARGQVRVDEAFADHEARARRLIAAVCLGCGSVEENEDAPALAIPQLPAEENPKP